MENIEVMMKSCRYYGFLTAVLIMAACADTLPVAPVPVPTPVPTPAPAPTPVPAPSPTAEPGPCDGCEPTVTNRSSPVRLTLRLYAVEDGLGRFLPNPNPLDTIPLGWFARLDVVAKDAKGDETNGNEEIRWHFSDCCLVRVSGNHTHQRRLKVLTPGYLDVWVTQEGVRSNTLSLSLAN
jgi:hypothetical protein